MAIHGADLAPLSHWSWFNGWSGALKCGHLISSAVLCLVLERFEARERERESGERGEIETAVFFVSRVHQQ